MGDVRSFQRNFADPENPAKKVTVNHTLRDHSASRMFKVGRLDQTQYEKAIEIVHVYSRQATGLAAFDPARPKVDQSGHAEPQLGSIDAVRHLNAISSNLGAWAYEWLAEVLFQETDFSQSCTKRFGLDDKKRISGALRVFHDILERAWNALEISRNKSHRHTSGALNKAA